MMALGERTCPEQPKKPGVRTPLTFVADESTFFHRILTEQKSVLIADTNTEEKWRTFKGHKQLRSWLLRSARRFGRVSRVPFPSATPSQMSIPKIIFAVLNCWPFLPRQRFRTQGCTKPPRFTARP